MGAMEHEEKSTHPPTQFTLLGLANIALSFGSPIYKCAVNSKSPDHASMQSELRLFIYNPQKQSRHFEHVRPDCGLYPCTVSFRCHNSSKQSDSRKTKSGIVKLFLTSGLAHQKTTKLSDVPSMMSKLPFKYTAES